MNNSIFIKKNGIPISELLENLRSNVFKINYNNIILGKKSIADICILTKSKVVLWDYVNMTATLKEIKKEENGE